MLKPIFFILLLPIVLTFVCGHDFVYRTFLSAKIRLLSAVIITILVSACSDAGIDRRLAKINELTSTSPREALDSLASIDYVNLPEADRHYYDLMSIKANDKAYIVHTSDSLILSVVDYYSDHGSDARYAEALYYAGRVYSDLGDAPTALRYFQQALEMVPDDYEYQYFKGGVLSQTGRMLNSLRLYSQGASYIEEAISINKSLADTFNMAFDYDLLSNIYLNSSNITRSYECNTEAIKWAAKLPVSERAHIYVGRALIQYEKGEIDSALQTIRPLYSQVDSISRNYMLSVASRIYKAAGILDTAYMYAYKLAMSQQWNNRNTGFNILLSPEMRGIVDKDSIISFLPKYHKSINHYLETHEAQEALIQNASYNYQIHVQERKRVEASRLKIERILFSIIVIVLIILIVSFYVKYRDSKEILRLRKALDVLESLQTGIDSDTFGEAPVYDADSLRGRLLAKVRSLEEDEESDIAVPDLILQSKPYNEILKKLNSGSKKLVSPMTWDGLAAVVEEAVPGFKERLDELTDGKLSETNYQMVLLIKCGFSPTSISTLLVKAKGTISSNRRYLGKRIFGQTITGQLFDKIIRLL